MVKDLFYPPIIIYLGWMTMSLTVFLVLKILSLEASDFNAPFKKKTYITSPHRHRENLGSMTWKHVSTYPHRIERQMPNKKENLFIINLINICALL